MSAPPYRVGLRCSYCGEALLPDLSSLPLAAIRRRVAGHVRRHRDRGDDLSDARANAVIEGAGWSGVAWAVVPPNGVLVNLPTEPDVSGAPPVEQPPGDPATVKCYTVVIEWPDGRWREALVPLDANAAERLVAHVPAFAARHPELHPRLATDSREVALEVLRFVTPPPSRS